MSVARNTSLGWRGLRNYYAGRPFSVSFEVTHSCNARCKHCHLRGMIKDENRATPERFGELCRTLQPVVAQASGGEPLLRHDLEDIIRAFCRPNRAPMTAVTTNAALLTRKRYTSLREAGVDEFSISLDYPDERHDEFRGIPGLFGKIRDLVSGLKDMPNRGILFCAVVQSDNLGSLVRLAELAHEWNVKVNFSAYTTLRTRNPEYLLQPAQVDQLEKEIVPRLLELRQTNRNVLTSAYALNNMVRYFREGGMPGCGTGRKFLNVNPDGTLSPCGLVITSFQTREELLEKFSRQNTCSACFTSMRANCEKPARHMLRDNLETLKMHARG
jgi:MoaA/NifB/PqqE/SkfB family radical SAM enzyme